jgi:hypothetical protein
MPSSRMLYHVALVRTDVPEERSASIISVTGIGELGALTVTSNRCTLRRNTTNTFSLSISSQRASDASYG